ncbi:11905_t:CDS:2 [Funneliformis caledonium]|uniref:11905_t:CDS:1 n=1 Tax=Funneliformis caledonium TaxID=1117310 RepID=A0A9N8YZM6_9GLOM|nr:11905_t:CDS:2 [Funneliformis caledonium]
MARCWIYCNLQFEYGNSPSEYDVSIDTSEEVAPFSHDLWKA